MDGEAKQKHQSLTHQKKIEVRLGNESEAGLRLGLYFVTQEFSSAPLFSSSSYSRLPNP